MSTAGKIESLLIGVLWAPVVYVFFRSVVGKTGSGLPLFALTISDYKLVPKAFVKAFAVMMLAVEMSMVVTALFPLTVFVSALIVEMLCVIFTLAQMSVIIRKMRINCGCFGSESRSVDRHTVIIPILCAGLGLLTLRLLGNLRDAYIPELFPFWMGMIVALWFCVTIPHLSKLYSAKGMGV